MELTRLTKQPSESRLFDFDFSGKMAEGATIATVVSVVAAPPGTVEEPGLTIGSTAFSGQVAQVRISAGTDQVEYILTCKVTTNTGDTLELDGALWVEDTTPAAVRALLQPEGELEPDLFADDDPGGSTRTRIVGYLAAYDALVEDFDEAPPYRAQAAYVYWRALTAKARAIKSLPLDRAFDQGQSRKYTIDQIRSLEADAARFKAVFDELIGDTADESAPRTLSRAVRNEVVW